MSRRATRKSMRPYAPEVRRLALNLKLGEASPTDIEQIVSLLRAIANGRSIDEGLGIPVIRGAPQNANRAQRAWDVAVLVTPIEHGGEGMRVGKAFAEVAKEHKVTEDTVRKDWYSEEGRKVKALAKDLYNPLALPEN